MENNFELAPTNWNYSDYILMLQQQPLFNMTMDTSK